ncbi:unnamed protein product [Heligmosomoides polygyrus]|uniref:DUF4780 domain-containing protein n=1 Tax=Heligmosomoides polygyrus TaxID=6339 RepID=A0A183GHD5_HELPZ|nr:unnamed protein product [Heligmosomoides polygyrus]
MLRTLCGCPPNKVDDKNEVVVRDYRDTVFVYASQKVLVRSLLGTLLSSLENINLSAVAINMIKPNQDVLKKSTILKKVVREAQNQNEVCVVSLWRGEGSFKHVQNVITQFCKTYAFVNSVDVAMTDTTRATRREAELWIALPTTSPTRESNSEDAAPATEPPNLQEESMTPEDHQADSSHPVRDPDDVVLVRESSTADTLPVGDKLDEDDRDQTADDETHPQPPPP